MNVYLFILCGFMMLCAYVPAHAAPMYQHYAQCSGMYLLMKEMAVDKGNSSKKIAKFETAGNSFFHAAVAAGKRESVVNPTDTVQMLVKQAINEWDAKIGDSLRMSENKEWVSYCKKLGKASSLAPFTVN